MTRITGVSPFTEVPITPAAKKAAEAAAKKAAGEKPATPPAATRPANNSGDSLERSTQQAEGKKKGKLRQFLSDIAPFIQHLP